MSPARPTSGSGLLSFRERPIAAYFLLAFAISWIGAAIVALHGRLRGQGVSKVIGIVMFPAMLLGPSAAGILLTRLIDGRQGLTDLFSRMRCIRIAARWYAVLLLPQALVLGILLLLTWSLSPAFRPNHFYKGVVFGVPAGFFEEIGWTGFAFPKMRSRFGFFRSAIVLGIIWGAWHLPVINFLGAAAPHGSYWLPFFLAFIIAMTAIRVLIGWVYVNTKSVLLTQLLHVSSTGALVIFSPLVSAARETVWYVLYGLSLWVLVAILNALGQLKGDRPISSSDRQAAR